METLTKIESIEVDNKDRPIEDIIIEKVQIFVDPYQEADEQLANERQTEIERVEKEKEEILKKKAGTSSKQPLKVYREGVGKYLNKPTTSRADLVQSSSGEPAKKKKNANYDFGDFKAW